jgi:signal transduction histidine kinase
MRVLSAFVRDTSHEFRTPLSIIKINAYMAARAPEIDERKRRQAGIDDQIERISRLIDQLLLMVRLDSDPRLDATWIDLRRVVEDTIQKLNNRFANKAISVHYAWEADVPPVCADHELLCNALNAVLQNSFQYTPKGGAIHVRAQRDRRVICIQIQDTGMGMSEPVLEQLFQRFYRADEAHSTAGFGLGLPIAQRIVELHGGHLQVTSAPNEGTTVHITLPLA